uniref:Putative HIRAN domain containing protein n=2 Tax=viral metagenome TaxID=1070528 RepID=A0A6M3IIY0_9ZZZZ
MKTKEYSFYVAGVQFHQAKTVLNELSEGMELSLIGEPDNKFDPNAIKILYDKYMDGYEDEPELTMLGYVPKKFSAEVSAFMELNEYVVCELIKLTPSAKPWEQLKVKISLGLAAPTTGILEEDSFTDGIEPF